MSSNLEREDGVVIAFFERACVTLEVRMYYRFFAIQGCGKICEICPQSGTPARDAVYLNEMIDKAFEVATRDYDVDPFLGPGQITKMKEWDQFQKAM